MLYLPKQYAWSQDEGLGKQYTVKLLHFFNCMLYFVVQLGMTQAVRFTTLFRDDGTCPFIKTVKYRNIMTNCDKLTCTNFSVQ